jgi:hypothetical protein
VVLARRRASSYNTIQFTQVECEAVDRIFVAESLLEGARDCSERTNDEFVRTGGEMSIAALVLLPARYLSFQQSSMQEAERDKTCDEDNLPQQILLRPNEPTVVDWFILSKGATSLKDVAWYEPLQPGKYMFSDQRRLSCCDGPLIDTDRIELVVAP